MRIVWLSYYYLPHVGGGTWATFYLSQYLAEMGHSVTIISPNVKLTLSSQNSFQLSNSNSSISIKTPSRFLFPRLIGPLCSIFPMFVAALKKGKESDIIICQFHPYHFTMLLGLILGKILRIPVVARADDIQRDMRLNEVSRKHSLMTFNSKITNFLNEAFIKYTNAFFVSCSDQKKVLIERLNPKNLFLREKVLLSFNGYDESIFKNIPKKTDARRLLGIKPEQKVLLFLGRFSGEEYGANILFTAFSKLSAEEPNALLLLVGDKMPLRLGNLGKELGIDKKLLVFDSVSHEKVVNFIIASDVCIGPLMPTMAMPLKVLEYMACGKIIVLGKGSTCIDLNPDSNFIESPVIAEALCEAISVAIKKEECSKTISNEAKLFVNSFTWKNCAIHLEKQLAKIMRNGDK